MTGLITCVKEENVDKDICLAVLDIVEDILSDAVMSVVKHVFYTGPLINHVSTYSESQRSAS